MSGSLPLDLDDVDAITDALTAPRDRAAFLLSCGCGLRAGTLTRLRLSSVLNRHHELTGQIEIPRRATKGQRAAHSLPIPPRALQALGIWIAQHPAPHRQAPIFPSRRRPEEGITPRQWQRIISAAAEAAALAGKITPHSARKFFAHAIYESTDKDVQLTTRALGNRSPLSTMHYLDFAGQRIHRATLEVFNNRSQLQLLEKEPEQTNSNNT